MFFKLKSCAYVFVYKAFRLCEQDEVFWALFGFFNDEKFVYVFIQDKVF